MTFDTDELQQPIKVQCIDNGDGTEPQMWFDCEDVTDCTSASRATTSEHDSDEVQLQQLMIQCIDHEDGTESEMWFDCEDFADSTSASRATTSDHASDEVQLQQPMIQCIEHEDGTEPKMSLNCEDFADSTSASGATTSEYDSDDMQLQQPNKVQCIEHGDGTESKMLCDCADFADSTSASGATISEYDSDEVQQQLPMKVQCIGHGDGTEPKMSFDCEGFAESTSASGTTTSEYASDDLQQLQQLPMKIQCTEHGDGAERKKLFDCEYVGDSTSASGVATSEYDSDDVSDEKLKNVGSLFKNLCTVGLTAEIPPMQPPPGLFPIRHHGDAGATQPYCDFDTINAGRQCDSTYFHGGPSFMQDPEPYLSMYLHPNFIHSYCYGTGFETGGRRSRPENQQRNNTPWTLIWVSEHAFKQPSESTAKVFETLGCKVRRYRTSDNAIKAMEKKAEISNTILLVTKLQSRGMADFLAMRGLVEEVPLVVLGKPLAVQHSLPPMYPFAIAESCEDALDVVKAIAVQFGFAWP